MVKYGEYMRNMRENMGHMWENRGIMEICGKIWVNYGENMVKYGE